MFRHFFSTKQPNSVGLDIGYSSIKLVQISRAGGSVRPELVNFSMKAIPSQDAKDLAPAIQEVIEAAGITTRAVNTSVAGQMVIVRYIQLPVMTRDELEKALRLNAGKYIPFSLEEVIYDFQILGAPAKNDKSMRVLLVAVKKEIIRQHLALLQGIGLEPHIIDVDSFAIVNSFQLVSQEKQGTIAVVDIGADTTTTTILLGNEPYFSRDIPLGGKNITEAIRSEFDLDVPQAEMLKMNPQDKYGDMVNAIKPVLDELCRELHMSFNYCEGQLGSAVQKLYLTGGTAKFKGIDKILHGMLGVETQVWDPTQILPIAAGLPKEKIQGLGPLLTVAIGLALRV
ncbi:MAG: type IV pilus assembly protein PilM [Candidatus Omnitrophica bacterium]|nr:type IV pilus assembly protein PilM [Candidatus Omnitrophota bacterium]